MTTIACNRKTMAGDTRTTYHSVPGRQSKLLTHFCDDGSYLVGLSGDLDLAYACAKELFEGNKFKEFYDFRDIDKEADGNLIVLTPHHEIFIRGTRFMTRVSRDYWAIGSGGMYAMAGLCMGLGPEESVLLANQLDLGTNDEVEVLHVE